jgi:glycyl-tRNA synthetase alpha chain
MYIQGVESVFDIQWNDTLTYRDVHHRSEFEFSHYNFSIADTALLFQLFDLYEKECLKILDYEPVQVILPAYDYVLNVLMYLIYLMLEVQFQLLNV